MSVLGFIPKSCNGLAIPLVESGESWVPLTANGCIGRGAGDTIVTLNLKLLVE
jgi:hypothetical protein